jgi:PAS domain S-box-containing protein
MLVISASAATLATFLLYRASFEQHRARLLNVVQHRSSIIKSLPLPSTMLQAEDSPTGPGANGLPEIIDVFRRFGKFGETGEFTLARRLGGNIVWLVRHWDLKTDEILAASSENQLAGPMRRALAGESGSMVGLDYRGEKVLAAYETIPELSAGAVAKIDISEINAPFLQAGEFALGVTALVIVLGVAFMIRATSPSITRIESRVAERTRDLLETNKQLREEIQIRTQVEAALRRMSMVFMNSTAPIVIHDLSGRITDCNAEVERTYGWAREELLGQPFEKLVPPEMRAEQFDLVARCRRGEGVRNAESLRQTKSGQQLPVLLTFSLLTDEKGDPFAIASIAKDLSEQKRLQHQLQAAASEAALAEERERRKLASDLHDGLGQLLALTGIKLGSLRDSAKAFGLDQRVREVEEIIAQAHDRTRRLSFQLSPPILHDVDFVAAAQWLADDMQARFGLQVTVQDDGQSKMLDEGIRLTLFRGLSELLLNIAKHAGDDKARVRLWREDGLIRVAVEDDGVGFDAGADGGGFGLLSTRERLNHLGGSLEIQSAPAQGTRIVMTGPIAAASRENG